MAEISNNLRKLSESLWEETGSRQDFIESILQGESKESALLWTVEPPETIPFAELPRVSFQPNFVTRVSPESLPGSHPLHDEGAYYCLDLSSVFEASILEGVASKPGAIIDFCASPGGKSIFTARLFQPKTLLCNDSIQKRTRQLIENLSRCRISAAVTSSDVGYFAKTNPSMFDLAVVDAPCSGQSLLAKGKTAQACFHPATINLNANRQRRIIANASAVVRPGGYLAYMTCTYSRQENEGVLEWFLKKFPNFETVCVPGLNEYRSHLSEAYAYRLFPHQGVGAGGFTTLLKRQNEGSANALELEGIRFLWSALGRDEM